MTSEEKDARAFDPRAGAIEALIETDAPVAPQHYRRPRKGTALCGDGSFLFAATRYGVTCAACRKALERSR